MSQQVRRADPARWLAARFAAPDARARLEALYAFYGEIARVREVVSDPMVGEIRLAWWREAVEEIADGRAPRRHPIVEALAAALGLDGARRHVEALSDLAAARERDLDDRPFASVEEASAYAGASAGALAALAAAVAAAPDEVFDARAARAAGSAWGLLGLARALPVHAALGWSGAPRDAVRATGKTLAKIVSDRDADALRAVAAPLLDAAEAALATARAGGAFSPSVWPAVGYAALVAPGARALRAGADPFAAAVAAPGLRDRARLTWAAARGRI